METPATIRRNPPRKAKFSSAEKSTVKEYRSGRKRYVAEGKTLLSSFTAAEEEDNRSKQTEHACLFEALQAENLNIDSVKKKSTERSNNANPKSAGNRKSRSSQQKDSVEGTCVTESFLPECSTLKSISSPSNAVEPEIPSPKLSAEKLTTTSLVGIEADNPQCEVPFARPTKKQTSEKMRIFLRIRPAQVVRAGKHIGKAQKAPELANRSSQHGKRPRAETMMASDVPDVCLHSQTPNCVTLATPAIFSGLHKPKVEEFNGFSRIFSPDSTQKDVFDEILAPRLADLLKGESSLVIAMGPTSAGKTHTMLGTPADPGLLPRSWQYLFDASSSDSAASTMKIVISMFEIYSEQGGRSEKILDLLQGGAELSLHQSKIKGLHEAVASTTEEADAIFLSGLQKRTTASTAANHQSSRSHCITNISTWQVTSVDSLIRPKQGTITIADLAGFEREKKTKNQGVRLNESSFINNTSMVFGQCLRALLEHQKNPKKTLQRHFQYSMLTRYLKPYMEANGNMTLIVNVSPCEEDYLDTAFVLRQAAPYSNIKFSLLPTKENVESAAVEKRSLSCKERQQPMKKRRKVDGAINASINLHGCSNARKSETVEEVQNIMPDLGVDSQGLVNEALTCKGEAGGGTADGSNGAINASINLHGCSNARRLEKMEEVQNIIPDLGVDFQGLMNEVHTCQGEAGGGTVDESMEYYVTNNGASLHLDVPEKLKAELLAEINHVLLQEGVKDSDRVCHAVMKILDNAVKHYHGLEDLEERFQQQHAEITQLRTELLKEQEHAFSLSMELENSKSYCDGLENQIARLKRGSFSKDVNSLRPTVTTLSCSPTKLDIQISAEGQAQSLEHRTYHHDAGGSVLAACSGPTLKKKLSDIDGNGSLIDMELNMHFSPDGQNNVGAEGFKDPSSISLMDLPFEENNCEEIKEFEDFNSGKKISPVNEYTGGKVSGMGANNTLSAFCTDNGQEVQQLQVFESEEGLNPDTSIFPFTEGLQCLDSELISSFKKGTTEGQTACQLALEVGESHEQQNAQHEGSQISQVNSLPSEIFEVSDGAAEEQVKITEQMKKSLCLTKLEGESKLHLGDHEAQKPEEHFKVEHGEKSPFPNLQKVLGLPDRQTTRNLALEKAGSPLSCLKEGKNSNLQKGRLLALALMQESKCPSETENGNNHHSVHHSLSTPISRGTLGPIGHDIEEILEIPLSELETDLWLFEAARGSRLSILLAKHDGLLDINNFPKTYSHQRANCIRFCLAVICGKMNVDGKWASLSKVTVSSRKSHFYAVIQARTVTEAAGHARAGFHMEMEALSNYKAKEIHRVEEVGADGGAFAQSENLFFESQDSKENRNCSPVAGKASNSLAPIRRRRLQPLSSLSLHADPNICSDFEFADASIADEVHPSKTSYEGHSSTTLTGNRANPLAYLLTRHNR